MPKDGVLPPEVVAGTALPSTPVTWSLPARTGTPFWLTATHVLLTDSVLGWRAFDASSGAPLWTNRAAWAQRGLQVPAAGPYGDTIWTTPDARTIYARLLSSGALVDSVQLDSLPDVTRFRASTRLFVWEDSGTVVVYDRVARAFLAPWRMPCNRRPCGLRGLGVVGDTLYVARGHEDDSAAAPARLDVLTRTGAMLGQYVGDVPAPDPATRSLLLVGRLVLMRVKKGANWVAIDRFTLQRVWSLDAAPRLSGEFAWSATVAGGHLIIPTDDGVAGADTATGAIRWFTRLTAPSQWGGAFLSTCGTSVVVRARYWGWTLDAASGAILASDNTVDVATGQLRQTFHGSTSTNQYWMTTGRFEARQCRVGS